MNKLWVGSIYYFLNVLLHIGVLVILYVISADDSMTLLEYGTAFWQSEEGRELTVLNISLLSANLAFAITVIMVQTTIRNVTLLALIAWIGLVLAYLYGTVGLVAYAAGAIHLTSVCYFQRKSLGR